MADPRQDPERPGSPLSEDLVRKKAERRLRARRTRQREIWFGLGTFGIVGWSVAVPTVLGVALGVWIDRRWPGPTSWTLTFLVVGLVAGCMTAWRWMRREGKVD